MNANGFDPGQESAESKRSCHAPDYARYGNPVDEQPPLELQLAGGRSAVVAAGSGARAAIGELGEPPCQGQRHALSLLSQGHSCEPYRAYAHRTARGNHTIKLKRTDSELV